MKTYLDLLQHILDNGVAKEDRTGTGTISVFGYQMRFDLSKGFPLLTTKKVYLKGIIHELLWFIKGDTNIRYLVQNNVHIWDEWPFQSYLEATGQATQFEKYTPEWKAKKKEFVQRIIDDEAFASKWGDLGPVYGKQWRNWEARDRRHMDQLAEAISAIKNNPSSRRILVSAWNVGELGQMALMPCHLLFQFYVADGKLSCQLYQRSADVFLGVPFNIASYALLTMMVAQVCGLEVGEFVHTLGDAHLYSNHIEQAKLQLSRAPRRLPNMILSDQVTDIEAFKYEDFALENYHPHPAIKAMVAV